MPATLTIDAHRLAPLEAVLDQLPFLHVCLDCSSHNLVKAFASPVMRKIRALSYDACASASCDDNSQSTYLVYFRDEVLAALTTDPRTTTAGRRAACDPDR